MRIGNCIEGEYAAQRIEGSLVLSATDGYLSWKRLRTLVPDAAKCERTSPSDNDAVREDSGDDVANSHEANALVRDWLRSVSGQAHTYCMTLRARRRLVSKRGS